MDVAIEPKNDSLRFSLRLQTRHFDDSFRKEIKRQTRKQRDQFPDIRHQQTDELTTELEQLIKKQSLLKPDSHNEVKISDKRLEIVLSLDWIPLDEVEVHHPGSTPLAESLPLPLPVPIRSFDDELRKQIKQHTRRYNGLFSKKGLQQTTAFMEKLAKLIDNQILLRPDTQGEMNLDFSTLQADILSIEKDYQSLKIIASNTSNIIQVNEGLLGILKANYQESLSLDVMNANRFDRQVYAINIIRFEVGQFAGTMREKLKKIPATAPVLLYQSAIDLQKSLYEFLQNHKSFFHEIELERKGFCFMMRRFCEESRKDILFNSALEEMDDVIKLYENAAKGERDINLEENVTSNESPRVIDDSSNVGEKKRKKTSLSLYKLLFS